jgi:hypothetical protein
VARAFDGSGESVENPGEVRAALQCGLKTLASGRFALIDIRLVKAAETNERPDRANYLPGRSEESLALDPS